MDIITKSLADEIISTYHSKYREFKNMNSYSVKAAISLTEWENQMAKELASKYGITFSELLRICLFYFHQSIKHNG